MASPPIQNLGCMYLGQDSNQFLESNDKVIYFNDIEWLVFRIMYLEIEKKNTGILLFTNTVSVHGTYAYTYTLYMSLFPCIGFGMYGGVKSCLILGAG